MKVAKKAVCINNGIDLNSIAEDIKAAAEKHPIEVEATKKQAVYGGYTWKGM